MPNVIILMVNFPEDFMTIFTHEPLCLQDAVVNGGNWSLAGHKKKQYAVPFHGHSLYVSALMNAILCVWIFLFTVWVVETSSVMQSKEM